jgi:hypothetical protein
MVAVPRQAHQSSGKGDRRAAPLTRVARTAPRRQLPQEDDAVALGDGQRSCEGHRRLRARHVVDISGGGDTIAPVCGAVTVRDIHALEGTEVARVTLATARATSWSPGAHGTNRAGAIKQHWVCAPDRGWIRCGSTVAPSVSQPLATTGASDRLPAGSPHHRNHIGGGDQRRHWWLLRLRRTGHP